MNEVATFLTLCISASTLDYFVAGFFLLGLIFFLILQSRHFRKMEKSARETFRAQDVVDELAALRKVARPLDIDLGELESRLVDLCDSNVRLESRISELRDLFSAGGGQGELRSVGLQDVIEQRLYAKGFQSVALLADIADMEHGEHTIPVEVMKGNVPYKGNIVVRDGRVVSENLSPIYKAFP